MEEDRQSAVSQSRNNMTNLTAKSATGVSHDSKQLVNDFESALSLLKDGRPGKLSPDEAVMEQLIVNHNQRETSTFYPLEPQQPQEHH